MNLEKLKDTARKFEQKEEWRRAIDVYLKAIQEFESGHESSPDLSLYNRVGDLYLKINDAAAAVQAYERAVTLYAEQGFLNNAIALCGKILRVNPGRTATYLQLAQLHARKNVVIEAKRNLLEYIERMNGVGQLDEAFRAVKDFADQFSLNQDIRLMLVELLRAASREDEAREQLEKLATELEARGDQQGARKTRERLQAIGEGESADAPHPEPSKRNDLVFLDTGVGSPKMRAAPPATLLPDLVLLADVPAAAPPPAAPPPPAPPPDPLPALDFAELEAPGVPSALADGLITADPIRPGPDALGEELEEVPDDAPFVIQSTSFGPIEDLESTTVDAADPGASPIESLDDLELLIGDQVSLEPAGAAGVDARDFDLVVGLPLVDGDAEPSATENVVELDFLDVDVALGDEPPLDSGALSGADASERNAVDLDGVDLDGVDLGGVGIEGVETGTADTQAFAADPIQSELLSDAEMIDPGEFTLPQFEAELPLIRSMADESDGGAEAADIAAEATGAAALSITELEDRVLEDPDDPDAHRDLGRALLDAGDRERSVHELEFALGGYERANRWDAAGELAELLVRADAEGIRHHQKRVELAYRGGTKPQLIEAYLDLGDALARSGAAQKALAVFGRVTDHDPVNPRAQQAIAVLTQALEPPASAPPTPTEPPPAAAPTIPPPLPPAVPDTPPAASERRFPETPPAPHRAPLDAFVDLESLILEDQAPRDTRMRIERAEEPSGDEQRDFQEMLQQFKRGIEQNLDDEDHQAHYDLGVAFKEMGLLDEAIAEFQRALRGPEGRLRTSEALGVAFVEKGQFAVAETVLRRAMDTLGGGDDEKIGLIYWLGRACEAQEKRADALASYERALAVDIQFRDVGDRIHRLAGAQSP